MKQPGRKNVEKPRKIVQKCTSNQQQYNPLPSITQKAKCTTKICEETIDKTELIKKIIQINSSIP